MATTLGKRTRVSPDDESPLKRARRQTRSFVVINDENQDPHHVSFEDALAADISAQASSPRKRQSIKEHKNHKDENGEDALPARVPLTPSTPRHQGLHRKSSLATATPSTPPVTPTTPRHRVMSVGRLSRRMTPHRMGALGLAGTPGTPGTPAAFQTVYHKARQLFARSAGSGALVGREEERTRLGAFLRTRCADHKGGCLYVSGPPGTGKSAMVTEVTDEVTEETSTTDRKTRSVRKAYINCMSIRSSGDLYSTLLRLLLSESELEERPAVADREASEAETIEALQALFVPKQRKSAALATTETETSYVVVLDEMDHILTLDLESLYRVMGWSMLASSRLVLVGIANALDLTDRFLPRLKSRNLQPELLPFLPYTAPQIKTIITTRLRSAMADEDTDGKDGKDATNANYLPFFHPAAVELCARKVASQTGDLRKAFEILRRALDVAEAEAKEKYLAEAREAALTATPSKTAKQPLGENMNLASSPSPKRAAAAGSGTGTAWLAWARTLTAATAPRVSIGHLNKVTAAAFGHGAQQRLRALNLQQKAALCALLALEKWTRETHAQQREKDKESPTKKKRGSAAPTIKMLFETYSKMCKRDAVLHPLSSSEFREVVGSLETLSLVTAVDGRTGSFAVLQASGGGRRGARGGAAAAMRMAGVAGDEKQVASCVGERELEEALEGPGGEILRSILRGELD